MDNEAVQKLHTSYVKTSNKIHGIKMFSGSPWNLVSAQGVPNASMMGLPDGRKSFKIGLVVLTDTQPASQTDRQTDRQTDTLP